MRRHLYLVGMMGSGKTTTGQLVADRLGWPFVDLDHEVARSAGRTVPAIFAAEGERGFRARERAALLAVASSETASVVATGGGTVLSPENRACLRETGTTVWLRAAPEVLEGRLGALDRASRPLLSAADRGSAGARGGGSTLQALAGERAGAYRDVADHVVDVDALDPVAAADAVLACMEADA